MVNILFYDNNNMLSGNKVAKRPSMLPKDGPDKICVDNKVLLGYYSLEKDFPNMTTARYDQNEVFFVKIFSDLNMMRQVKEMVDTVLYERLRTGTWGGRRHRNKTGT